ncbi:hypothetical protein J2Z69_001155 [Paenibacillus shirakamiensis]|uniref:Uncharacterized protein n=1 Tax=Paenibacillus shirakamiensis TaxID=1265935 RepID=A0ABS4JEK6_9BACL|nr:hypothetical protein [Paenibacillus shirakamiensis]MBP2000136.1 hypothetical protein [Paenibacillus shirakamiensis]
MKFWQKAFLGVLMVFIVSLNIALYLTSRYSFELNLKRDTDRALGEYHFIINGLNDSMNGVGYQGEGRPSSLYFISLVQSYANYYRKQQVFLSLKERNHILFSNIPERVLDSISDPTDKSYRLRLEKSGNVHYLMIAGPMMGQYTDVC